MASPPLSRRFATSPGSAKATAMKSPLSDEAIWKKLRESGFDEESIRRRDKAALIAYISKLEAEIFDHQHHMGLLILERKEWTSKYQEIKDSAEAAELKHRCDLSAQASALAEAKKREESLKKALRVEKECIANLEKALHEMRAEAAETKVAAESKLADVHTMEENAIRRSSEADAKFHAAEALEADANRYRRTAERKMQEVEAREDDLRRRLLTFKSECDAKEKELSLERQALSERQKTLQQEQEQLLDGKALLNQREEQIFNKSQELYCLEKGMENSKSSIEKELRALNEEKSVVDHLKAALLTREEELVKKEAMLNKREQDLLILQEKLASKEHEDAQKLKSDHENALKKRMADFDMEMEKKLKIVENEIEKKRRDWELREVELNQRQDLVAEREHDLEYQSRILHEKESDILEKLNLVENKEETLSRLEKEIQSNECILKKEEEQLANMREEFKKSLESLNERKKQIDMAEDHLEAMKSESSELLALEVKLKEEIDMVRAEKSELMVREEELKIEKAKFEAEWEALDEKREELRREAERVKEERLSISKFLKEERELLRVEKELMREDHHRNVEALSREREEFMAKNFNDRTELFNKIQHERYNFLEDIDIRKRELENCIEKRHEELETQFKEKYSAFEIEKKRELDAIHSLQESVAKDLETVAAEMKRLDAERLEIKLDRERRDIEWAELINSIEELKVQSQKLKEQRESLHADKEEISSQIDNLKKLEQLKIAAEKIAAAEREQFLFQFRSQNAVANVSLEQQTPLQNGFPGSLKKKDAWQLVNSGASLEIAPLTWFKRCAKFIFKEPSQAVAGGKLVDSPAEYAGNNNLSTNLSDRFDDQVENPCIQGNLQQSNFLRIFCEESKEIAEVPSDEVAKGSGFVSFNTQKQMMDRPINADSEKVHACSKRKNDTSSSQDIRDSPTEEGQSKKRKQEKVIEENTNQQVQHSFISTKASSVLEMPVDHNQGNNDEGDVVVIDRFIKVTEVSCVDTQRVIPHDKLDSLKTSVLELDRALFRVGESVGNSSCIENGLNATAQAMEQSEGELITDKIDEIMEASIDGEIGYHHDEEKRFGTKTKVRQKA